MILSLTPNMAVDRTLILPAPFQPGDVTRAREVIVAAGGKGINVGRVLRTLGEDVICMGFLGGNSGDLVADLAAAEGLPAAWTRITGETRTCVIAISEDHPDATVFNEQGPVIKAEDWERLKTDVLAQAAQVEAVCLCGSLPLGVPATAPADLIRAIKEIGKPVWVDTSKSALESALTAQPTGIKVNATEVGDILGVKIDDREQALAVAGQLLERGIEMVVLTLGGEGAIMVTAAGRWWVKPPSVRVLSTVGSGDSFTAALVTSLTKGASPAESLRRAVAAGTANALHPGGGILSITDYEQLLAQTSVNAIG